MDVVADGFGEIYGREPVATTSDALTELLGEPASVR